MNQDLIGRVRRLLVSPAAEWETIAGETADMATIYKTYVGPLVIAAALAQLIGALVFGYGFGFRPTFVAALSNAIFAVVFNLALVYVFALIIDALAPSFGATKNFGQAFKVAAYAPTASWVGSLLLVLPIFPLRLLSMLVSLYSLYLLFIGLPKLMKCAEDKAIIYVIAVIGVGILLAIAVMMMAMMTGFGFYM